MCRVVSCRVVSAAVFAGVGGGGGAVYVVVWRPFLSVPFRSFALSATVATKLFPNCTRRRSKRQPPQQHWPHEM